MTQSIAEIYKSHDIRDFLDNGSEFGYWLEDLYIAFDGELTEDQLVELCKYHATVLDEEELEKSREGQGEDMHKLDPADVYHDSLQRL